MHESTSIGMKSSAFIWYSDGMEFHEVTEDFKEFKRITWDYVRFLGVAYRRSWYPIRVFRIFLKYSPFLFLTEKKFLTTIQRSFKSCMKRMDHTKNIVFIEEQAHKVA